MKQMYLGKGLAALVDDCDFDWLSQFTWGLQAARVNGVHYGHYARTRVPGSSLIHMQVMIMGRREGFMVDHKNRNSLDNQRHNLRWATNAQNNYNSGVRKTSKTGYKGVLIRKPGVYRASIRINKKLISLGDYRDPISAARAYNEAAMKADPEFAWLNPIPENN